MLVDALREDFVEFDDESHINLQPNTTDSYRGYKINLF